VTIKTKEIQIKDYTTPSERLSRKLEVGDSITMWGIVDKVNGNQVQIHIGEISIQDTKFSASMSGCSQSEIIRLTME